MGDIQSGEPSCCDDAGVASTGDVQEYILRWSDDADRDAIDTLRQSLGATLVDTTQDWGFELWQTGQPLDPASLCDLAAATETLAGSLEYLAPNLSVTAAEIVPEIAPDMAAPLSADPDADPALGTGQYRTDRRHRRCRYRPARSLGNNARGRHHHCCPGYRGRLYPRRSERQHVGQSRRNCRERDRR